MIRREPVLRVSSKLFIPFIMLFGLYVQFHGDFGPGGGFQAGAIFAAAFVLHAIVFGVSETRRVAPPWLIRLVLAVGVLLYAGVGVASFFMGGNFLDYGVLDHHDPVHGQHLGILLVEAGVGLTVAGAMITIFLTFAACRIDGKPE
ncbi:MAG: Na(+)/H(+) antiporter subunit B [Geminicoccaceae bacterium]